MSPFLATSFETPAVHEIDEADGRTFIAMAFIKGESVEQKIEAGPRGGIGFAIQIPASPTAIRKASSTRSIVEGFNEPRRFIRRLLSID